MSHILEFLDLVDAPPVSDYGSQGGKAVAVNSGETALEFITAFNADQLDGTDLDVTSVSDGEVLIYDGVTDNRWENTTPPWLDKAGGTMAGYITLHADPSNNMHAATKQYIDNNFASDTHNHDSVYLKQDGSTPLTSNWETGASQIILNNAVSLLAKNQAGTGTVDLVRAGTNDGVRVGADGNGGNIYRSGAGHSFYGGNIVADDGDDFICNTTNGPALKGETPSATNPTVLPDRVDVDTGLGRNAANALSLIAGGTEAARLEATQLTWPETYHLRWGAGTPRCGLEKYYDGVYYWLQVTNGYTGGFGNLFTGDVRLSGTHDLTLAGGDIFLDGVSGGTLYSTVGAVDYNLANLTTSLLAEQDDKSYQYFGIQSSSQKAQGVEFSVGSSTQVTEVRSYHFRVGTPDDATLRCQIWNESGGEPNAIITNGQQTKEIATTLTTDTDGQEVIWTFSPAPSLSAGTYYIVFDGDWTPDVNNHVRVLGDNTYSGAHHLWYEVSGTWTEDTTDTLYFQVFSGSSAVNLANSSCQTVIDGIDVTLSPSSDVYISDASLYLSNNEIIQAEINAGGSYYDLLYLNTTDDVVLGDTAAATILMSDGYVYVGTAAAPGDIYLYNNRKFYGRNNAGSAWLDILRVDTADNIRINEDAANACLLYGTSVRSMVDFYMYNTYSIAWRNAGNTAWWDTLTVDASDRLILGAASTFANTRIYGSDAQYVTIGASISNPYTIYMTTNATYIYGKTTGATNQVMIGMTGGDQVRVGNVNTRNIFYSNGNMYVYGAGIRLDNAYYLYGLNQAETTANPLIGVDASDNVNVANIGWTTVIRAKDQITLQVADADANTQHVGYYTTSSDPSTTEFPSDKDWGFHENSTSGSYYFALNDGGTIKKVALTTGEGGSSPPSTTGIISPSGTSITSTSYTTHIDVSDGPGVLDGLWLTNAGTWTVTDDEYYIKVTIDGTAVINGTLIHALDYDDGGAQQTFLIGGRSTCWPCPLFYRSTLKIEIAKYDSGSDNCTCYSARTTYSVS